jgi:hypothetical protein
LTEVPEELGELVWLEELSFSGEWWDNNRRTASSNKGAVNKIARLIPAPFVPLKKLRKLWLRGDYNNTFTLTDLSPLSHLLNLQLLSIENTEVSDLSPLAGLAALQSLSVWDMPVSDLSPLAGLAALQALDVGQTLVSDLSPLAGLVALQAINIKDTPVSDLSPLAGLAALQSLDVRGTQVSNLSPLAGLAALQLLDVGHTPVSDLSPLAGLAALQSLDASGTQVSDLSPLAGLAALQSLDVSYTQVSDLSPLAGLAALQALDVNSTKVSDLSSLAGLAALQLLYVGDTPVSDLSPLLPLIKHGIPVKWERWADGICVKDCPLTNPPIEIVKQGNAAILRYFDEQSRVGTIKVREAKLLLVGQGRAGKTTLKRKLQNPNADMPAPGDITRGIDIIRLDEKMPQTGEALRINVWDFGGQDIQYYAHQFFLTGNSLYALVTNERIQDSVYLPYWLNIIEMLGKKSPVLLIQNKDAGHCQALRDEAAIRARFANVHNRVYQTDLSQAPTEAEFAALRQEIIHQAALLPHIERDYLASFAALRTQLEQEADRGSHYLRWEAYLKLMPDLSEELLGDYANSLTSLGVCQYFPHDALLREYLFLRPKWIIDALFTLLLDPLMETQRGHFNENDTRTIWQGKEYQGMHPLLVRMMEEFELCYRVEGNGRTYILPQRLPSERDTYGWHEDDDTTIRYEYKFMPKGILTRLICRLHPRIETDPERGQRVWCDAVIFALPDNKGRVFAREVFSENVIELRAAGHKREDILGEIIRTMDDINRDGKYDNLKVEKLLPCPCHECLEAEEPGFHEYEALYKRIEKNKDTSECKKSGEDVLISDIFGKSGVKRPELRNKNEFYKDSRGTMSTPLKIFISYSHAQKHDFFPPFNADFRHYAKLPKVAIEVFTDEGIPLGSAWDEYLQNQVAHCDVMLLLVSQEFLGSDYIQEKEFGAAIKRLKAGNNLLIVPIYFTPCQFTSNAELATLQFFKPEGHDFDKPQKGDHFAYADLIKFNETNGQVIPNANRQHYMMALMAKLTPELKKLRP